MAAADASTLVAERDAEIQHLRTEIERQGQTAQADIAAAKAAAEADAEERMKTAQAKWDRTAAAALADTVGRCEAAEAALETARKVNAKRVDDDEYVHTLEREIKTLRATLVDREATIVGTQAMQEHERLGTVREAPGRSWQPLSNRHTIGESEPSEQEKSNRRLIRDAGVVVMAAAAAVLLFPKLEAMLPDTVRWQIETVGGLFAPADTVTVAAPPPAVASTQPKAEHPLMYASRSINVRAEPSVSATIVVNLKRGASVAILEKRGSWDRVEVSSPPGTAKQTEGWVFNTYLVDTDPSVAAAASAPAAATPAAARPATPARRQRETPAEVSATRARRCTACRRKRRTGAIRIRAGACCRPHPRRPRRRRDQGLTPSKITLCTLPSLGGASSSRPRILPRWQAHSNMPVCAPSTVTGAVVSQSPT